MQTTKDPQSINELLGKGHFKALLHKAQQLQQIGTFFEQLLPSHLRELCTVMNIKHLQLIVGVSSAAALTECRFLEQTLLSQLKQQVPWQHLRGIKFKVQLSRL